MRDCARGAPENIATDCARAGPGAASAARAEAAAEGAASGAAFDPNTVQTFDGSDCVFKVENCVVHPDGNATYGNDGFMHVSSLKAHRHV